MKAIHKKRLATLALALLDHWDARRKVLVTGKKEVKFRMMSHLETDELHGDDPKDWECGTSCCFMGFAPFTFPATRKMDWGEATEYVTGDAGDMNSWGFLFGAPWKNDPVQAAKRALYVIQDKPPIYTHGYVQQFYPYMSKAKLRAALLPYAEKGRVG